MRILVTGGAGFIGSHLVEALVADGHSIRVLDALVPQVHGQDNKWPTWLPPQVEKITGDVRCLSTWREALEGIEAVYHLAAEVGVGQSMYEITRYMDANTMGTANLLQLLASKDYSIKKLIVASSMSIYGEGAYRARNGDIVYPPLRTLDRLAEKKWDPTLPGSGEPLEPIPTAEDKPLHPTSIYAISKRDQEEMCLAVGKAYEIPTVALRFFNVYGPRQSLSNPYTGVAAIFSSRLLNNKPPIVFEDGLQSRDFVHVKDIVQGLLLALKCDEANYEAINLGTGRCLPILEMAQALIVKLNVPVQPQILGQYRKGDIRHCYADIRKAQRLLGFRPTVAFEDGVGDLVEWIGQQTATDQVETAISELATRGLTN